jgi:hypothetical protein
LYFATNTDSHTKTQTWGAEARKPDDLQHRAAHCWRGPAQDRGYMIGLDLRGVDDHAKVFAMFDAMAVQ